MRKIYHLFLFAIQYYFYHLITPLAYLLYKNKYPWIICERGDDARDNGYTFFNYLRHEQQYINVYYLIDKHSSDYPKVKVLGKAVRYKSFKHWLLYRVAEARMSTHLAAFAPGNYIGKWFMTHKQCGINVFLQHGITHNEFLSNYYEYNGSDLFICGAKPEYDYISKNDHYPEGNVVYTGFSRFDELHNFKTKDQILVMPTWRSFLSNLSKEEFKESLYFKSFDNLLRNKELNERLEKENLKLIFYIHYSLQPYVDCFKGYGKNIIIADFDHYDVQTLLKESKLLITDYSSIFFDFTYMRKSLIYYQFDVNDFYGKHYQRSYFSHKDNGFGPIVETEQEVINQIFKSIDNNFELNDLYKKRIDEFFPLYDTNNSRRIFDAIINNLIDKRKYPKNKTNEPIYLTFTGDDYGRNRESTLGMNEAFKKGYIQQASFMVNRSEEDHKFTNVIHKDNIVYHFNITEGYQSFGDTTICAYTVNRDSFGKTINRKETYCKITKYEVTTIKKELYGQLNKYKDLSYICIAFDSHGHMHNRLPIAKFLIPKCKEEGFKVARIPANIKHHHFLFDVTYKKYVTHLYRKNFITTDYFCSCYDLIHLNLNKYKNKTIEVMTHPFMYEDGMKNRRDIDFELMQKFINKYNVELINYNDLIKLKEKKHG